MSAELITAILAVKTGITPDFEAGRQMVPYLTEEDYSLGVLMWLGAEYEDMTYAADCLIDAINRIQVLWGDTDDSNLYTHILGGYDLLVMGAQTCGDTPEGVAEACAISSVARVRNAIGFVDITTGEVSPPTPPPPETPLDTVF